MISILLATYNGEKYLREQLDSLLAQTVTGFRIVARDDGSTDGTMAILEEYQNANPSIISVCRNARGTGGAKHNFWGMMSSCRDDYIMLCDQDDVWLPCKVALTLEKMREMEARFGDKIPLAVHTDLTVVDEGLYVIADSFRRHSDMDHSRQAFRFQLVQAIMTGCTVMYNRPLAEYFTRPPDFMVMHDWWIMLTASALGKVGYLEEPTILYRQHTGNVVGARDVRTLRFKIGKLFDWKGVRQGIRDTFRQAESFLRMYRGELSPDQAILLENFSSIPGKRKLARWRAIRGLRIYRAGFLRNVVKFLFI